MIDGINGGPRGLFGPRPGAAPAAGAAAQSTTAADPQRAVRRIAEPAAAGPGRTLVAELAAAPPVSAVRVAELQAAIAEGRYRIEPERIADAMLTLERGRP